MNTLACDGLRAENPMGFLAALGLLRLCAARGWFGEAKLSWTARDGFWRASLHTEAACGVEDVCARLTEEAGEASKQGQFTRWQQIKSLTVEEFRTGCFEFLSHRDWEAVSWMAAYASDMRDGETVACSPFDMTVARQKLLADYVKLSETLAAPAKKSKEGKGERFREALAGPWRYAQDQHSLGWDPVTLRLGAFTTDLPSKMSNAGVEGAVWLAFQALPLFPCFRVREGLGARGWQPDREGWRFLWPVWEEALGLRAIKFLLASLELSDALSDPLGEIMRQFRKRGVCAVYTSRRMKPNKYMTALEPATALPGSLRAPGAAADG